MSDRNQSYADAIVALAKGEGALDTVDDELLRVAQAVQDNRDLHEALTNSQYPVGQRLDVVDQILGAAHPATRTAVAMLVASGRARDLNEIAHRVAAAAAEERQRQLAEVWVAVPLKGDQRDRLQRALEEATGSQIDMKVFVDPSVVGGVRAKVGDTVIDGTVARRLENIKARVGAH